MIKGISIPLLLSYWLQLKAFPFYKPLGMYYLS